MRDGWSFVYEPLVENSACTMFMFCCSASPFPFKLLKLPFTQLQGVSTFTLFTRKSYESTQGYFCSKFKSKRTMPASARKTLRIRPLQCICEQSAGLFWPFLHCHCCFMWRLYPIIIINNQRQPLTKQKWICVTLLLNKIKNKLRANEAENLWKFKDNQPQLKIWRDWFLWK